MSNVSNPNPHDLTFPYPLQGDTVRPPGKGCTSCVHQTYCPAVYWLIRFSEENLTDNHGRACASYSDSPNDVVTTVTDDDVDEVNYAMNQGFASEAKDSGISGLPTGKGH